ncbi:flagellar basal body protein, partial [Vibrio parahaemolyticus]
MGETTIIHLSRLIALERRLDNVANNVANADTTG